MEGEILTQSEVTMPVAYLISCVCCLVSGMCGLFWLYNKIQESRQAEAKENKKEMIELTKGFIESTNATRTTLEGLRVALENNTRVIENFTRKSR